MSLICTCLEVGIDIWHKFVYQNFLESLCCKLAQTTEANLIGHAIGHNYDKRFCLTLSNKVVHDKIGMSLIAPCCLVLAPSVLQVKNRIFLFLVLAILRWSIDKGTACSLCALRPEQNLLNIAMRHILHCIEVLIVGWNLYTTLPACRTKVVHCSWVVDNAPVYVEVIIVETLILRSLCRSYP